MYRKTVQPIYNQNFRQWLFKVKFILQTSGDICPREQYIDVDVTKKSQPGDSESGSQME